MNTYVTHFIIIQIKTEGIIKVTGKNLPSKPSYGHICKIINRLSVNINNGRVKNDDDEYIIIVATESTDKGNRQRSRRMDQKWNVLNRKGYLKIHVAVNIKTKEIHVLEVTDDKVVHDGTEDIKETGQPCFG